MLFAMNPTSAYCEATIAAPDAEEFTLYVVGEKLLGAVANARGDEIELIASDSKLVVKFSGGKTTIPVLHGDDVRKPPEKNEPFVFSVDPEVLQEMLSVVSVAARDDFGIGGILCDDGLACVYASDIGPKAQASRCAWGSLQTRVEEGFPTIKFSRKTFSMLASCCYGSNADVYASDKSVRLVSRDDSMAVESGCQQTQDRDLPLKALKAFDKSSPVTCNSGDFFASANQMAIAKLPEMVTAELLLKKETISFGIETSAGSAESVIASSCDGEPNMVVPVNVEILQAAAKCFSSKSPLVLHVCARGENKIAILLRREDSSLFFFIALMSE